MNIHHDPIQRIQRIQHSIHVKLRLLRTLTEIFMATIDQLVQDVNDEDTLADSVGVFIAGLKQQLADALSGTTLPPDVQAKIDAAFATAEASKAKLSAAIVANTPSA